MIVSYKDKKPIIDETVFIAKNATVAGDVVIGENSGIWFSAVIRADVNYVRFGKNSNLQDLACIHNSSKYPTIVGDNVTIGHAAVVHACQIGDNTLIGMNSTILDGAVVGNNCIIGANALVSPNTVIPDNSLAFGNPARVIRKLKEEEIEAIKFNALKYSRLAKEYKEGEKDV